MLELDLEEAESDLDGDRVEEFEREPTDLSSSDLMFMLEFLDLESVFDVLLPSDLLFVLDLEPTDLAPVDLEPADCELADLEGDFAEEDLFAEEEEREVVDLDDADREGVDLDSSMSIEAMLLRPTEVLLEPDAERVAEPLLAFLALLVVLVDLPPLDRPVVDGLLVPAFLDAIWNLLSKITFVII